MLFFLPCIINKMFLIYFFWLLLLSEFRSIMCVNKNKEPLQPASDKHAMATMMFHLAKDVIKNQNETLAKIDFARHDNSESAAFEVGYMTQMIQEHYRRMLDKWRSVRMDIRKLYTIEVTLYLEEIEHLYWSIKHEVYMLHEIERKYQVKSAIDQSYEDLAQQKVVNYGEITDRPYKTPKPFNNTKLLESLKKIGYKNVNGSPTFGPFTTQRPKKTYFPLAYGWDLYEWSSDF